MTRYLVYQAHMAGGTITETLGQAAAFLELTSAEATGAHRAQTFGSLHPL